MASTLRRPSSTGRRLSTGIRSHQSVATARASLSLLQIAGRVDGITAQKAVVDRKTAFFISQARRHIPIF
jgi:hypothetical protein